MDIFELMEVFELVEPAEGQVSASTLLHGGTLPLAAVRSELCLVPLSGKEVGVMT